MKPPLWTSLALVVGLVLMLGGPLSVSYLMPTEALWTNADAEKLSQAGADLHAAIHAHTSHDHSHNHGPAKANEKPLPDLAAAQQAFDQEQARLTRSHSRRHWLWYGTSIIGALIASAGIAGYFLAGRAK